MTQKRKSRLTRRQISDEPPVQPGSAAELARTPQKRKSRLTRRQISDEPPVQPDSAAELARTPQKRKSRPTRRQISDEPPVQPGSAAELARTPQKRKSRLTRPQTSAEQPVQPGSAAELAPTPQKHTEVVAIYPGSFDPITTGHLDVIERGSRLFDRLIVSVLHNGSKSPLFSVPERIEMLTEAVAPFPNVEVDCFGGLLADYALSKDARVILRGIRAISDYENELQMALMNRRLQPGLETVFLLAGEAFSFISSRLVKEVISLGGNIGGLVPPLVEQRLRERLRAPLASSQAQ